MSFGSFDRVDLAAAEQQPPVRRLAEIAHDEARIRCRLAARQHRAVVAQRHGGADEGADRHDVRGTLRLEVAAIGVDRDQALLRRDRAARRRDDYLAAIDGDAGRLGVFEQLRAGLGRHPRRADDQLQRMDMAGAGVAHAAEIMRRPQPLGRLGGVHEAELRIAEARRHRLGMFPVVGQLALLVNDVEMAGPEVDVDLVGGGELEQMRLGLLGEVEQRLGAFEAEFGFQFLRPGALAGAKLAAIAARCAVAEAVRLDQHHAGPGLGQMGRRRQAGKAAADDDDVGRAGRRRAPDSRAAGRRFPHTRNSRARSGIGRSWRYSEWRMVDGECRSTGSRAVAEWSGSTLHCRHSHSPSLTIHTFSSRNSRSHGLITSMKVSNSARLIAA